MASTIQEPSQAERLEAVAEATIAGPGATDKQNISDPLSEKADVNSSSNSSVAAAGGESGAAEAQLKPEAPQRSAGKIALIMGSLCVSNDALTVEKRSRN